MTTEPRREDRVLFDVVLRPHRSLGPHGFVILMAAICAVSFTAGSIFFVVGAWPVIGFLGLDVALIYLAFRINYRRAHMYETLRLTRDDLVVEHVDPSGESKSWTFQPAWLQVVMDETPRRNHQLTLRSHGRNLAIGRFLSAEERVDLARALSRALETARGACRPCAPAEI